MVDFSLTEEQREVRDWVRTFVRKEIMPLEPEVLRDNPKPTDEEIREGLSGNFCRCTGYQGIINAVHRAAETT
jgi:alkylation response protein AidB-like acyl-CoA dehydrogenase